MEALDHIERSVNDLAKDLFREDEMGAVIRAHIRLESILFKLVDLLLPSPREIKRLNLDYDGYVSLALALGLDSTLGPALRGMGTLRNSFAHKLDTTLDPGTVTNLYQTLPSREKEQVQKSFARIRTENETLKKVSKFAELPPADQFKLIAVILWAALQAAEMMARKEKETSA